MKKQIDNFIMDERIGGGSYGEVWRAHDVACSNHTVALRVVSRQRDQKLRRRLQSEVRVLRQVSHENILAFYGLRKTTSRFYLALEYCAGGDLAQLLRLRGPLSEADSWRFCVQITAGLLALHCQRVFHGNLQPRNVLLSASSEAPKVKLANFGSVAEPTPYTAPEVLRGERCDVQADMWSAGAILYEMMFGRPPVDGVTRSQLLGNHLRSEVDFADGGPVTGEGRAFCRSLLGRQCSERLSSEECAEHIYVKQGPIFFGRRRQDTTLTTIVSEKRIGSGASKPVQIWRFSSLGGAVWPALAQRCLQHILGLPRAVLNGSLSTCSEREVGSTSELIESRRRAGVPQPLQESLLNKDPLKYFIVGQLRSSHFFRLRTSRLFPRILYSI